MLHVWDAPLARATKDLDFLGRLDNSLENLERVVRDVCAADVAPDGMVFDPATVKTERIKEDADYEDVRVRFVGLLGRARVGLTRVGERLALHELDAATSDTVPSAAPPGVEDDDGLPVTDVDALDGDARGRFEACLAVAYDAARTLRTISRTASSERSSKLLATTALRSSETGSDLSFTMLSSSCFLHEATAGAVHQKRSTSAPFGTPCQSSA